jgi:hypothetical protein
VSPATPFSVVSLPNHTKMFELVHEVTSMDDFGTKGGGGVGVGGGGGGISRCCDINCPAGGGLMARRGLRR